MLTRVGRAAVPAVILVVAALSAIGMHRNGHTLGDDFTLYLRQASSIFEGNPSQVVADNRFMVLNSPAGISPIAYPWGFPLLLSPFVHQWGFDYDKLKLVEVASFIVLLVLLHGIVRRRTNRWIASGVMAMIALAPVYLGHTDQLLTEYPHLAAVLLVVWWIDRFARHSADTGRPWLTATTTDLVIAGLLAAFAFNVRREAIVFFGVFAAAQVVDVVRSSWPPVEGAAVRLDVWRLLTPHLAMVAGIVSFQLVIPSMLIPDNGGSAKYIPERIGDSFAVMSHQLGFGKHTAVGVVLVVAAVIGAALACRRDPVRNVPLATLAGLSMLSVSTHFRLVDRYYLQVAPFVVLFAAYFLIAAIDFVTGHWQDLVPGRAATWVVAGALAVMIPIHINQYRDDIDRAQEFNDADAYQWGPGHPGFVPILEAVKKYTPPHSVIGFFRARTMTLYTNRLAIQPGTIETLALRTDYYAMQKNSTYSQPLISDADAEAKGMTKVWEDGRWVLWEFPEPAIPPR